MNNVPVSVLNTNIHYSNGNVISGHNAQNRARMSGFLTKNDFTSFPVGIDINHNVRFTNGVAVPKYIFAGHEHYERVNTEGMKLNNVDILHRNNNNRVIGKTTIIPPKSLEHYMPPARQVIDNRNEFFHINDIPSAFHARGDEKHFPMSAAYGSV